MVDCCGLLVYVSLGVCCLWLVVRRSWLLAFLLLVIVYCLYVCVVRSLVFVLRYVCVFLCSSLLRHVFVVI